MNENTPCNACKMASRECRQHHFETASLCTNYKPKENAKHRTCYWCSAELKQGCFSCERFDSKTK